MTTGNPYVGPRAFAKSETLYGRDRELRTLTDRLIAERIVLLHAPSGAGKTSLVQAGLIPKLAEEGFFVHPTIRVNVEYPTDLMGATDTISDPRRFNRFVFSALLSLEERYQPEKRTKLNRLARLSMGDYLALRSLEEEREGPEFMIFDQFEEILSIDPNDRATKVSFFSQLRNVLKNRNRWALFITRTDYVGALEPYARSIPTYFSNTFHLELLGVKAAMDAVQQPARNAGVEFTDSAAQKLVDDLRRVQVQMLDGSVQSQLGLYIEPVQLQVACYRMWENKSARKTTITEKDLDKVGDVNQSLGEYYAMSVKKAAEETGVSERDIRQWFDRKLITPEGTRSLVRIGTGISEGLPNEAVHNLEDTHLIRPEKRAGQTWYELAHDRLIEPVRSNNKTWFETNLNLFQHQAHLWVEQGRGEGLLLRGNELDVAEEQAKTIRLTPDEAAFLKACQLLRQREQNDITQRRLIAAGFLIASLLFLAAVFFSVSALSANRSLEVESRNAREASILANEQKSTAEAASIRAASQQATAEAASTQAIANAQAAATAQALAEVEKQKASEQEQLAREQKGLARANELAVQSILAQNSAQISVANLLAVEAFQIIDHPRTRAQLLSALNGQSRLFAGISGKAGIIPYVAFDASGEGVITGNFFNCDLDAGYNLCRQTFFRSWEIKAMPISNNRAAIEFVIAQTTHSSASMLDAVTLSPDGRHVASVYCAHLYNNIVRCEEQKLVIWDAATFTSMSESVIATDSFNTRKVLLAYSPDGQTLAATVNDEIILLLETQNYTEKARFEAQNGISQLAFSPDSKTLAVANGSNNTLTFIDTQTFEVREQIIPANVRAFISLAYNPDASVMALGSSEGLITLWDVHNEAVIVQLYDREGRILSLAFSPDNQILAAGHNNYYVTLWDIPSRQLLVRPFIRHSQGVQSLDFSADGERLVSSGGEVVLWDLSPESWLKKSCEMAGRNFTVNEWHQYFPDDEYRLTCPQWPAGK